MNQFSSQQLYLLQALAREKGHCISKKGLKRLLQSAASPIPSASWETQLLALRKANFVTEEQFSSRSTKKPCTYYRLTTTGYTWLKDQEPFSL